LVSTQFLASFPAKIYFHPCASQLNFPEGALFNGTSFLLASSVLFCYTMGMLPITIRKRTIAKTDLQVIQDTVSIHWDKGRTQISKILCQHWNWFQPNGRPKDMACRELLLTLHRKNLISLPPGKHDGRNLKRNRSIPIIEVDQNPFAEKVAHLPAITLTLVRINNSYRFVNRLP